MAHHSRFRDFITFLSSVKGDFANITSPPFFLASESVVEVSTCWTERPSLYVAAALESDPQKRALLVLKWILASHRRQFYVGANTHTGIKKPLNAFLGEVFFGQWTDDVATTKTVTEQVSHHPPITACYMVNDKYRIWGDGYSKVEMTFNGNLNVKQTGHAMLHLDEYNEHHLIPFQNVQVKGFLSGHLYPEVHGTYHIVSSAGFVSEITYSGKGFFSGAKNSFQAKVYRRDDELKTPIYTLKGCWSDEFTIFDGATGDVLEKWVPDDHQPPKLEEPVPIDQQDPWESRRAWKEVIAALKSGDLSLAVTEKSKVEEAQRAIRKANPEYVSTWDPLFFSASHEEQTVFNALASAVPGWELHAEKTKGVWRFDHEKAKGAEKPYHNGRTPTQVQIK